MRQPQHLPPLPIPLRPIAKSADYTCANNELVQMSGQHTVTLPAPLQGRIVGVQSVNGTGAAPCTVTSPSGVINGPGAGTASILLGDAGTYVVLEADGTNWNMIAGQQDSGWISVGGGGTAPAFQNGWVNTAAFQTNQFRKIGTTVYLRGAPNAGTNGSAIYTLPAGYRPQAANTIWPALNAASPACYVQVTSAGAVLGVTTGSANFHYAFDLDVSA